MAQKIDEESKRFSLLLTDVDRYRIKYQTREVDALTDTNIVIRFVSPVIFTYENFRYYFLKNSVIKEVSQKNFLRPDYVSYEEYGTTTLWSLLLFVNDIPTIEEFTVNNIYVPTIDSIYRVARETIIDAPTVLKEVKNLSPSIYAKIFAKEQKVTIKEQDPFVVQQPPTNLYFVRQTFDITIPIASQQFIDLAVDAIPESIVFKIKDKPAFAYGRDYILMKDSAGLNRRVSWSINDVTGSGLVDVIDVGMILEIQYAKEI